MIFMKPQVAQIFAENISLICVFLCNLWLKNSY